MLSMHALTAGSNYGNFHVTKNDDVICDQWVTQDHRNNILSCSTVTHLDTGDKVKVTGDSANTTAISGDFNGFSGILIYPE